MENKKNINNNNDNIVFNDINIKKYDFKMEKI